MSNLILGISATHRIDWKLLRIRPQAEQVYKILTPSMMALADS